MTTHIIAYESRRLSLGLMQPEYGPDFVRFANRYGPVRGTRIRPPYTLKDYLSWLEKLETSKGKNEAFAILLHEQIGLERTYRYIGHTGVHDIRFPEALGATGSIIGDPNFQGMGLGKEAKLLLQRHAFHVLNLYKLRSAVKAFNANSLGHLLACGYRIIGRATGEEFDEGKRIEAIELECLARDWEEIWKTYQTTGILPRLTDEQRELVRSHTNKKSHA
ncbi:MAG TPA: GNAT family protein [Candidatus Paceibacterota bacterium]|nr:GNAT family protein [Candidatus Paceibacterota bacterium]